MKYLRDMTEPEIRDLMTGLAQGIQSKCMDQLEGRPLFVLLLFNDPEVAQYIANCQRSDCIKALRECADRLERKETVERTSF